MRIVRIKMSCNIACLAGNPPIVFLLLHSLINLEPCFALKPAAALTKLSIGGRAGSFVLGMGPQLKPVSVLCPRDLGKGIRKGKAG